MRLGTHHSLDSRGKITVSRLREKNGMWKGGVSLLPNYEKERHHRRYIAKREQIVAVIKKYRKAHPEVALKGYRTYHQKPQNKLRHARQESRRREKLTGISPLETIFGSSGVGKELHHTGIEFDGKFVGIYIPKMMNRGHSALPGRERNLDVVNWNALEFWASQI